jgi:hypothetical protein
MTSTTSDQISVLFQMCGSTAPSNGRSMSSGTRSPSGTWRAPRLRIWRAIWASRSRAFQNTTSAARRRWMSRVLAS